MCRTSTRKAFVFQKNSFPEDITFIKEQEAQLLNTVVPTNDEVNAKQ